MRTETKGQTPKQAAKTRNPRGAKPKRERPANLQKAAQVVADTSKKEGEIWTDVGNRLDET